MLVRPMLLRSSSVPKMVESSCGNVLGLQESAVLDPAENLGRIDVLDHLRAILIWLKN